MIPQCDPCRRATLAGGSEVCSCSEAWREQCEAATILRLPTLSARRARLAWIEARRGKGKADRLRALMIVLADKR